MSGVFEVFCSKVQASASGCWEWTGYKSDQGYAVLRSGGRRWQAYRFSYEVFIGEIGEGLYLDHLCRNPSCVNPLHLEPVTNKENVLRGIGPSAQNARKVTCINGHPFTRIATDGSRRCQTCMTIAARQQREANGAAGLCKKCGGERAPGRMQCQQCIDLYNAKERAKR